jgi:hypothetical protein
MTNPQFRAVCRVGEDLNLDAMLVVAGPDKYGYFGNFVWFNLSGGGERFHVGFILFTTDATGTWAIDADHCEEFPNLDTAIREYAERLLTIEWRLGAWGTEPPAHPTLDGGIATAFTQKDVADAQAVANSK